MWTRYSAASLGARMTHLLPHNNTTACAVRGALQGVVAALKSLLLTSHETNEILERVLLTLGTKPRPIAARSISKFHDILHLIGTAPSLLRPWLNPRKRKEIQQFLDHCLDALPEFSPRKVIDLDEGSAKVFECLLDDNSSILLSQQKGTVLRLRIT